MGGVGWRRTAFTWLWEREWGGMSDGNGKAPLCALFFFFFLSGCYVFFGFNKGVVTYCKIILKKRG